MGFEADGDAGAAVKTVAYVMALGTRVLFCGLNPGLYSGCYPRIFAPSKIKFCYNMSPVSYMW